MDIRTFITGQGAPLTAERHAARLVELIETLESFPHRGRHIGGGVRELTIVRPHIVRYRVRYRTVQILRIRHGAMRPTP